MRLSSNLLIPQSGYPPIRLSHNPFTTLIRLPPNPFIPLWEHLGGYGKRMGASASPWEALGAFG